MAITSTHEHSEVRDGIVAVGQRIMAKKGYSAVGINEILTEAGIPKGSFYHYFGSKDAFGETVLSMYFERYWAEMDVAFGRSGSTMAERLIRYFDDWRETQSLLDCQGKCLAVKLGAEVADLSEPMRTAMKRGTAGIITRLADAIQAGKQDRSVNVEQPAPEVAESLYQLWVGASVMAKIARNTQAFDVAMAATRRILQIPG